MKIFLLVLIFALSVCSLFAQTNTVGEQLVVNANNLFKEGKVNEAQQAVEQAIKLNRTNYLAYAVAAKIASKEGDSEEANDFLRKALEFAPDEDKDKIQRLAARLALQNMSSTWQSSASLSGEDRAAYNALMSILNQADKVTTLEERQKALGDFMSRSADFVKAHPDQTGLWIMRAFAAIYLERPQEGWEAGQHLKALGSINSDDADAKKVLADLQVRGWLDDESPQVEAITNYSLGLIYEHGQGVAQDYAQALNWFLLSAAQGNAFAQNHMGWMFENGLGVSQDYPQAAAWYRKSAEQGNAFGQENLGVMYQHGRGVPQDYVQAAVWFQKSAAQGNALGESSLGWLCQNGWGLTRDYAQAADWYRKSAEQGNAGGQCGLGVLYQNGWGLTRDYAQALDWYRKSAAQDNAYAENHLGGMYENGLGVKKDIVEAKSWYQKAANQGNASAKERLAQLNKINQ